MTTRAGGNSQQGGSTLLHATTPAADFAAFDQLPPTLRMRIATCAFPPASEKVLIQYRRALVLVAGQGAPDGIAEGALALWIEQFEATDIADEAYRHRLRYGYDLPHQAAGVSIQRGWGLPLRRPRQRST